MLADLLPLMTEPVEHWHGVRRDIHGNNPGPTGRTLAMARVTYVGDSSPGPASQQSICGSATTMWLVDHPRPIATGDTFKLPTGDVMTTIRVERRAMGNAILSKVFLRG